MHRRRLTRSRDKACWLQGARWRRGAPVGRRWRLRLTRASACAGPVRRTHAGHPRSVAGCKTVPARRGPSGRHGAASALGHGRAVPHAKLTWARATRRQFGPTPPRRGAAGTRPARRRTADSESRALALAPGPRSSAARQACRAASQACRAASSDSSSCLERDGLAVAHSVEF